MPHSGNVVTAQGSCLEDSIIEDNLEDADDQFSLKTDELINTWKEESKPLSYEIKPNKFEGFYRRRVEGKNGTCDHWWSNS